MIEKLGYENGGRLMDVTFELPDDQDSDPIEYFIDLSLGLIPRIETTKIKLKDMRFGIEAPELTQIIDTRGFLTTPDLRPVEQGTLVLYTDDYSEEARLEVDIFIPKGFAPEVIKGYEKIRYAAPFCDFIVRENQGKLHLKWPDASENYKLKDLFSIAQIFLLLEKAKNENLNIISEILFRDKVIKGSGLTGLLTYPNELITEAFFINFAWKIAKHFDVQDNVSISMNELLRQNILPIVFEILNKEKVKFQAKYWLGKNESHNSQEIFTTNVFPIALGEYILCFSIIVGGLPQSTPVETGNNKEWHFYTEGVDLVETKLVRKRDIGKLDDILKGLVKRAIAHKPEDAVLILTEDIKDILYR